MSTEIKNTLFRFVTMRAPELLEEEKIQQKFVKHPEAEKELTETFVSEFLQAIYHQAAGKTKQQSLKDALVSFQSTALKKKEELYKTDVVSKDFYDFALWLTKNRNNLTLSEAYEKTIVNVGGIVGVENLFENVTEENLLVLWDNLFYQIITQESSYVRENILSMINACFFIKNYNLIDQTNDNIQKLAQARIIVPKAIFEKSTVTSANKSTQTLEDLPFKTKILDTEVQISLANDYITQANQTIAELKRAQTVYDRNASKAYNLAKKEYDATVAALYAGSETTTSLTDGDTDGSLNVIIPSFEFEKEPELDTDTLSTKVSSKSMEVITNLVDGNAIETFEEVMETLIQNIDIATQFILKNSDTTQSALVSNGIIMPTQNTVTEPVFSIGGNSLSTSMPMTMVFSDAVNNANVVSAAYTATFDDEIVVTSTSFTDSIINGRLSTKIFLNPNLSFIDANSFALHGIFTLSDGSKIYFNGTASLSDSFFEGAKLPIDSVRYFVSGNGKYVIQPVKGAGSGTEDGDENNGQGSGETTSGSTASPYVPSGFGVKRMGIADYRKVEQEVCCYVPGEVSHIENIMAREYKEKATRRLRRSEDTTTSSSETEKEKLTDTTSTERFEMNNEVASVVNEDTSIGAHGDFHWGSTGSYGGSIGADFAHNTSTEESNNQAVTHAKDVTERALDRVVQKVKEERITKIVDEFEETNKHGFDNTKGDKHVSGVYRWVDKIYRNKVINYGKRLMYEFMIPQPAVFDKMATSLKKDAFGLEKIEKPIDPRTAEPTIVLELNETFEAKYKHWAALYKAKVEPKQENFLFVGKSIDFCSDGGLVAFTKSDSIKIPEGYKSKQAQFSVTGMNHPSRMDQKVLATIADKTIVLQPSRSAVTPLVTINEYVSEIPVNMSFTSFHTATVAFNIKCELTDSARQQWQIETFNAIIEAYEEKLAEYNAKISELKALQTEKVRTNPMFYRQIENTVLRKNAIEYMASQEKMGEKSFLLGDDIKNIRVDSDNPALEEYAAKVKFFEQAFEWSLMSYFFYPFYWAEKSKWADLYNINDIDDHLFRAFLQSGMARVIVTVRPGFEEAVNWYMATGQVWNGGQVPTMDDPMFVSIIEELRETEGEVEETWETRVPTSLTVIQAGSIGLNVEGLPCDDDCADYKLFDSDGQPVFDQNGKQVSTNPIVQSLNEDGSNVVLNDNNDDGQTPPIIHEDPNPTSK